MLGILSKYFPSICIAEVTCYVWEWNDILKEAGKCTSSLYFGHCYLL